MVVVVVVLVVVVVVVIVIDDGIVVVVFVSSVKFYIFVQRKKYEFLRTVSGVKQVNTIDF